MPAIFEADCGNLKALYNLEVQCYTQPWSKEKLRSSLMGKHCCFIMELGGQLVGHLIYEIILDELHLYNVCILPECQGKGLGQVWMDWLFQNARNHCIRQILLEVRISNNAAKKLYLSVGFNSTGVRRKYYSFPKPGEDALTMVKIL